MGRPRLADAYPRTPPGWAVVDRRTAGPFTTHVTYRKPDGSSADWSSRYERKHSSRLRGTGWRIGILFAIGSACFLVGPFPGFVQLVGAEADGIVFFVGSLFFTSAALLQYLEAANADGAGGARRGAGAVPHVRAPAHRLVDHRRSARRHPVLQRQHLSCPAVGDRRHVGRQADLAP